MMGEAGEAAFREWHEQLKRAAEAALHPTYMPMPDVSREAAFMAGYARAVNDADELRTEAEGWRTEAYDARKQIADLTAELAAAKAENSDIWTKAANAAFAQGSESLRRMLAADPYAADPERSNR